MFNYILAQAYAETGRVQEGLETLGEALHDVQEIEERSYEAELNRLTGEFVADFRSQGSTNGRHLLPQSDRRSERPKCQILGIARDDEPRASARQAGQTR